MPSPKPNEKKEEYIKRCIPIVLHEGTAKDGSQASAICHSMWDKHSKSKTEEWAASLFLDENQDEQKTQTSE